jgi:penicillin V acylase-like amidase (Ntn superfamily)
VKAAFYVNYVKKAETPDEAVLMLGHIINNFDRPHDLTVDKGPGMGDGPRGKGKASEVTEWTVMNDMSRNLYYTRSINSLNFTLVDMSKLKDVKKIKSLSSYEVGKFGVDATSFFLN